MSRIRSPAVIATPRRPGPRVRGSRRIALLVSALAAVSCQTVTERKPVDGGSGAVSRLDTFDTYLFERYGAPVCYLHGRDAYLFGVEYPGTRPCGVLERVESGVYEGMDFGVTDLVPCDSVSILVSDPASGRWLRLIVHRDERIRPIVLEQEGIPIRVGAIRALCGYDP